MNRIMWTVVVIGGVLMMCLPVFAAAPSTPANPTPGNTATGVTQTVMLNWDDSTDPDPGDVVSYELWMHRIPDNWPDGKPYTSLFEATTGQGECCPCDPQCPFDPHETVAVGDEDEQWRCDNQFELDDDGIALTPCPIRLRELQYGMSEWQLDCLMPDTEYVWLVVAVDDEDPPNRTPGPLWSFTTGHASAITSMVPNPVRLGGTVKFRGYGLGGTPLGIKIGKFIWWYEGLGRNGFSKWTDCEIHFTLPNPDTPGVRRGASRTFPVWVGLKNPSGERVIIDLGPVLQVYKP